MSFNSFNVWQCLLCWCLTGTLAGCNALGLPSFPFELHVLAPLWHWEWPWRSLRAARPAPSSVVICFLYLDSWGNVTSLLKLNYLIRTYHVLNIPNELKRFFFFSWNIMYCGFNSSCISYSDRIISFNTFQFNTFSTSFFGFSISRILITVLLDSLCSYLIFSSVWFVII